MLLFDSATRNQIYFLLVTPVFVAAATGWGLVELLRRVSAPVGVRVCVAFLVAGAVLSVVLLRPLPRVRRPHGFDIEPVVSVGWFLAQTADRRRCARARRRLSRGSCRAVLAAARGATPLRWPAPASPSASGCSPARRTRWT